MAFKLICLFSTYLLSVTSLGTVPDASQEGLLKDFQSYQDVTLFHYDVPEEVTRATFEFASFQDKKNCPRRKVRIHIQHGSYPAVSGDNSSFPSFFHLKRSYPHNLTSTSAYQPQDSVVYPLYNPLPGSWFVVAYLTPAEPSTTLQFNLFEQRCRYSLGSIALWNKIDSTVLLQPGITAGLQTKRTFSYFKFFVPEEVDSFNLTIKNCRMHFFNNPVLSADECLQYINIRARGLPVHDPEVGGFANISVGNNVTFFEDRPYHSVYYYVLVVSKGHIMFDAELNLKECGSSGIYGRQQHGWYLNEQGLMWSSQYNSSVMPKEPRTGFQLFSSRSALIAERNDEEVVDEETPTDKQCVSTFDFTQIQNVELFSATYMLQGRNWYTRWITVLEQSPIFTKFNVRPHVDIGGFLKVQLELDLVKEVEQDLEILACLSQLRAPAVVNGSSLFCDGYDRLLLNSKTQNTTMRVVPFPEPGTWYIGFQLRCLEKNTTNVQKCLDSLSSAMISVDLRIQPCDHRPLADSCGDFGVCVQSTKGLYHFSSCKCASGHRGWTCSDSTLAPPDWRVRADALLLTLSNLAFLPAIVCALYFRLFTEAVVFFATMIFSTLYHTCDEDYTYLPHAMEQICDQFFEKNNVLQFCDFFCAILSFWVTIISLAKLPLRIANFLNIVGVLIIAVLVQYNRTGILIFAIPIPLGILVLVVSIGVKSFLRNRLYKPNRLCCMLILPGSLSSLIAVFLFTLDEPPESYAYIHSTWHILIASSLIFLMPRCQSKCKRKRKYSPERLFSQIDHDKCLEITNFSSPTSSPNCPS